MARCGNCGAKYGCSCKLRKASDGKSCCANCISNYEKVLKQTKKANPKDVSSTAPGIILNATATQWIEQDKE